MQLQLVFLNTHPQRPRFAVSYWVITMVLLFVPKVKTRHPQREITGSVNRVWIFRCKYLSHFFFFFSVPFSFSLDLPIPKAAAPPEMSGVDDLVLYGLQFLAGFVLPLMIYLGIMFGIDVPGCGRGYLGPGGSFGDESKRNCTGGAARFVDTKVFTLNHMYARPTCQYMYQCIEFGTTRTPNARISPYR